MEHTSSPEITSSGSERLNLQSLRWEPEEADGTISQIIVKTAPGRSLPILFDSMKKTAADEEPNPFADPPAPSPVPDRPKEPTAKKEPSKISKLNLSHLGRLKAPQRDDGNEIIENRFLCRCGSMLIVGPTGIGKSSLEMQMAILWSLGRPCFGFTPTKPLYQVIIQAENDEGDLVEMRDQIYQGLELTEEEMEEADEHIVIATINDSIGVEFIASRVQPILEEVEPDVLWIDPLLAFLGGDVNKQEVMSEFLRHWLTPAIKKANCAAIILHHPTKPQKEDPRNPRKISDLAYAGAGSADLANWARAVVNLEATTRPGVFRLNLGKRGGRLEWTEADGQTRTYSRLIAHGENGLIYWRDAEGSEPSTAAATTSSTKEDVLSLVPAEDAIGKDAVISKAQSNGIGIQRARGFIAELISDGSIHEWRVKRPKTNPLRMLARKPQPDETHKDA
jgi:hypothetical protein